LSGLAVTAPTEDFDEGTRALFEATKQMLKDRNMLSAGDDSVGAVVRALINSR